MVDENRRMSWQEVFEHPLIKKKEVGGDILSIVVDAYTQDMLIKLQAYLSNHLPNWKLITEKYSKQPITLQVFQALLRDLNPHCTSH